VRAELGILVMLLWPAVLWAYVYDANDFATEVTEYVEGANVPTDAFSGLPFNDPAAALGRPTVDTTGDWTAAPPIEAVTVVPPYGPLRCWEIVSIGQGGWLTLKFNHKVEDNAANPYGLDFIVFGNAFCVAGGQRDWLQDSDPNSFYIQTDEGTSEPAVVSVSQDGVNWYTFENGPFADDFAPTLGRVYDPNNPDGNAFEGNLYWGRPTDPTLPIDPNLSYADFKDRTVAEVCKLYYGESAGGVGFDIGTLDLPTDPNTGLKWIMYVRIDNPANSGMTPEIDAVADVAGCGDWKRPFPAGDITGDCTVDTNDLVELGEYWLVDIAGANEAAERADIYEDDSGTVNLFDYAVLADGLGRCDCK